MRGPIVVTYDVAADGRRAELRARLRGEADRAQQSVWVLPPQSRVALEEVLRRLAWPLRPEDRLRLYEPCASCLRAARWLPPVPRPLSWWRPQVVGGAAPDGEGL